MPSGARFLEFDHGEIGVKPSDSALFFSKAGFSAVNVLVYYFNWLVISLNGLGRK